MCSDEQHKQTLARLDAIASHTETLVVGRSPQDATPMISATRPYVVDYKERKHLFLYSATTLTLTLEDLGAITIPQNTWTNIGFTQGMRLFASGQVANVPIFVRATDELSA